MTVSAKDLFSFQYGEKPVWETPYTEKRTESGNTVTTVFSFDGGLQVTNTCTAYPEYDAFEWVNTFENTGNRPTEILSELYDCDTSVALAGGIRQRWTAYLQDLSASTVIYAPKGSDCASADFSYRVNTFSGGSYQNTLNVGQKRRFSSVNGRSSEGTAPFFHVHCGDAGIFFAVGWTGQWNAEFSRTEDAVSFRAKIEDTRFSVLPGERFRTASGLVMKYTGTLAQGHNRWRRLLKAHFSPLPEEECVPLCVSLWGGMTSAEMLPRIRYIKDHQLPAEYVWIDAGWSGTSDKDSPDEFEGDWAGHVGDWRVNPNNHPDGLSEVRRAIKDAGKKFLLWFEIERAVCFCPVCQSHPEYFITDGKPERQTWLLNLGNRAAWQYAFDTLRDSIRTLEIDCYRQDFNMGPLAYWRANDAEDRAGMTEILHINGLYALWDALLAEFPGLLIDNCASGGRRIDIETLRRSVPLWRSDAQCPANHIPEADQAHNTSYACFLPYSGSGTGRIVDEYRIRSAYTAALNTGWIYSAKEDLPDPGPLKKYYDEYLAVRPYFRGDINVLTTPSDTDDVWSATEFYRPEKGDGLVQVFRRKDAPYSKACFRLAGIAEDKDYLFTDADGGTFTRSGRELLEKGFEAEIEERPKAKLYIYQIIK